MDIANYLDGVGGAAPRRSLISAGLTDVTLRQHVAAGRILSPRRGWYASPRIGREALTACAAGGRLACVSALKAHGVWVLADDVIHVACRPGHGTRRAGLRVHTGTLRTSGLPVVTESPLEALERLSRCGTVPSFVTAADSALHLGLVGIHQLRAIVAVSRRTTALVEALDARSESGTESLVRLALRGLGIRFTPQVLIPGVGRVDLVIGDRLVVELDSWTWHSDRAAFEEDRRRDLALSARGYHPLRLTYRRVLHDWPGARAELLALVRAGAHLWNASSRRLARDSGL